MNTDLLCLRSYEVTRLRLFIARCTLHLFSSDLNYYRLCVFFLSNPEKEPGLKLKIVFAAALVTAFISGIYLINSGIYAISSDETSRTLIAYYWFKKGVIESTSWLPLHFFIMGLSFNLAQDLIWMPRIVTLFFGMLTILNIGLISKELL
jgi:hypothetical protein